MLTAIPDTRLTVLLAARAARRELADSATTKASLDYFDEALSLWLARLSQAERDALAEWDALVDAHKAGLTDDYNHHEATQ